MQMSTFLKVKETEVDFPTDTRNPKSFISGISAGSWRNTWNRIEHFIIKTC